MKARDFVALVEAGVHAETEVGVAQRLLLQAQTALNAYADPDWACSQGWPAFADRLLELARDAEPGSDHQLAFVNALCTSALSLRHTRRAGGPAGHRPGRARDCPGSPSTPTCGGASSPRWPRAATSTRTATATPFIDAEAQRDPTAAGKRNAAAASAARPQAAVKEAAWQQVDRGRHDRQHHHPRDRHRFRPTRPGGAAGAVHRQVLRRDRRGLGATVQRGRADRRHRPVPVVGRQPGRPRRGGRVPGRRRAARAARLVLEGRAGVERALRARAFDIS